MSEATSNIVVPLEGVRARGGWNEFRFQHSSRDRKCGECGGYIQRGELYATYVGKCAEEGNFFTARTCLDCKAIWEEQTDETGEPMWFGGLYEELLAGEGESAGNDERLTRFRTNRDRRRGLFAEAA